MLIALPIGLWVFSIVADALALATGDVSWQAVSYRTMAGGLVTGVIAAVPGLIDFTGITGKRSRTVAVAHMAFNLLVMALYAVNLAWRSGAGFGGGPVALSAVALVFLTVSGWLGGELVYKLGMGVDTEDVEQPARRRAAGGR